MKRLNVDAFEVEHRLVQFKTSFKNLSLYAVGVKSIGNKVLRPLLLLRCALFCMYEKCEKHALVSVRLFVGLSLQTVTQVCMDVRTYVCTTILLH